MENGERVDDSGWEAGVKVAEKGRRKGDPHGIVELCAPSHASMQQCTSTLLRPSIDRDTHSLLLSLLLILPNGAGIGVGEWEFRVECNTVLCQWLCTPFGGIAERG